MGEEIITFGDIKVEKHKFHQYASTISMYDFNFDRIVVHGKVPFGKKALKYFVGYEDILKQLCPLV